MYSFFQLYPVNWSWMICTSLPIVNPVNGAGSTESVWTMQTFQFIVCYLSSCGKQQFTYAIAIQLGGAAGWACYSLPKWVLETYQHIISVESLNNENYFTYYQLPTHYYYLQHKRGNKPSQWDPPRCCPSENQEPQRDLPAKTGGASWPRIMHNNA